MTTVQEGSLVTVTLPTSTGQETVFGIVTHVERGRADVTGTVIHSVDCGDIEEPDTDTILKGIPVKIIEVLE